MKLKNKRHIGAFCISLIMFVSAATLFAQSTQRGLVLEYHGADQKTPLKSVSVSAANAASTISDDKGEFTLNFRTLHAGDAIQFRRVELSGYEVMNTEALEAARVARDFNDNANPNANLLRPQDARTEGSNPNTSLNGKPSTLNIVMIKREVLLKLRDGYRSVAAQRYEKQLKASEAEIERLKKEGQLAEEQYNERMNALEEEYEEKLTKLETYIDKFARIDLSDLDADEQQIIDLVQAGDFDAALDLYDKQNLADRLRKSREDQQKLVAMRDQLDEAARKKAIENQRLRQSIDRQVTLLYMAGGIENMQKAHLILKETFLADTTDWNARAEYAFSLRTFDQIEEMIALLEQGISIEKDDFVKGLMLLEIMDAQWLLEKYEESFKISQQAETLMMPLAESNFNVLTRALPAWSQIQLGYHLLQEDLNQCKKVADKLREHWSPDTLSYNSLASYVSILQYLNEFYSRSGNFEQTLWCASEVVRLGKMAKELNPSYIGLEEAYCTAITSYSYEGLTSEIRESARQCAHYLDERVSKRGTKKILADATVTYYQLIDALILSNEFALADSIIQSPSAIKALEQSSQSGSELIRLYVGLCTLQKARLLLEKGKIDQSEILSVDALKMIESTDEGAGDGDILRLEINSRISFAKGNLMEAASLCQDFIRANKETYKVSPISWNADGLCRSYLLMAEIYIAMEARGKAKKMIKEAEKIAAFKINYLEIERLKEIIN